MHLSSFRIRGVYQNVPASGCQGLAGLDLCTEDAIILSICSARFCNGIIAPDSGPPPSFLAEVNSDRAFAAKQPAPVLRVEHRFSRVPLVRRFFLCKSDSASWKSPTLDPHHVEARSFDQTALLKDNLPSGVGLGFGNTIQTVPSTCHTQSPALASGSLTPPPTAYVQCPRRTAAEDDDI
ncbi:hypothetical protein B0H10DRAFT_1950355 [Mycena sp. CBHHK59/15]|nr:hypothetical protein B0H10DRAFT_1950355 [Mycena sp. CBHHK59/15]